MLDRIYASVRLLMASVVGHILAWLASQGIDVGTDAATELISALGVIGTFVVYVAIRFLEKKWPWIGRLLGVRRVPIYVKPENEHVATAAIRRAGF